MKLAEEFSSYRQSEVDQYQMSFDQERFRYDERDNWALGMFRQWNVFAMIGIFVRKYSLLL